MWSIRRLLGFPRRQSVKDGESENYFVQGTRLVRRRRGPTAGGAVVLMAPGLDDYDKLGDLVFTQKSL